MINIKYTYKVVALLLMTLTVCFKSVGQSELSEFLDLEELKLSDSTITHLVQLSIENSYNVKAIGSERDQYVDKIRIERTNWLSAFRLGVNFFNVQTTLDENANSVTTAGLLNNVGMNVTFSPGDFINIGKNVRIAKNGMQRIDHLYEREKRRVAMNTVTTYNKYLEVMELIHALSQAYQIGLENHVIVSSRFKQGREQFDGLKKSQDGLLNVKQEIIKAKYQALRLKMHLEMVTQPNDGYSY